jgi:hypothetical protein
VAACGDGYKECRRGNRGSFHPGGAPPNPTSLPSGSR